ncbi:flavin reductase family protein [Clostridium grantii]|uniref:NADH-FMN oxidoreductase RutF, flavin reductase (DIM6/NTAB) family n=1 Tax=Clostridium grantii DSM 8605 TaxID=1121316 RepID=A0A1M5QQ34_9CLOT|nr:flavin reductase family protein [Clostridium grantii]SHH15889.1 NADH-FMN oxidoreductase RutF, flavin reductase (DIM6/NTAB) family [Clostridium grantii DSM 8605]
MSKKIFKGSVMLNPVPAVLVTSTDGNGNNNVFTVAWAGTICTKPPMLSISIRPERLSYDYIKATEEFVINIPSSKMVKELDYCGVRSGRKEDKIKNMNFQLNESSTVSVPYIDQCPISLECKVKEILPLGSHHMFLAEVLSCNVEESLIDSKEKIHFEKADLICYSHGEYFRVPEKPIGSFGFSVRKKKKSKK